MTFPRIRLLVSIASAAQFPTAHATEAPRHFNFVFGGAGSGSSVIQVSPADAYAPDRGSGFEPGPSAVTQVDVSDALSSATHVHSVVTSAQPFQFSVRLPEGNYRVNLTLGHPTLPTVTTVKAETRRLMLERVETAAGKFVHRSFVVNVRGPKLADGREVDLDSREMNLITREPIARHWDDKLTLAFSGENPSVAAIAIDRVDDVPTLFITGDSTVTDQPANGSWGQFVTRWFKPEIAVANHAESGETLKGFLKERRWQKILESIKPGDFVLIEFGTNDSKSSGPQNIYPGQDFAETFAPAETTYKELLRQFVSDTQKRGAQAMIASPSARRGEVQPPTSLQPWADSAMEVARELGIPAINLNALGVQLNAALGADADKQFGDRTHHSEYGAYLQAKCIVLGLQRAGAPIAKFITDDFTFDPAHPQPAPTEYTLPRDPAVVRFGATRSVSGK